MNRLLDLLLILFFFPVWVPVILLIFICAFLAHRKSIFFVQQRLGKDKKIFNLFKFRTMVVDAQHIGTGLYSYVDDPRITKFGKFLRRTSLDELPQLINVLKGEMSFIGPRPPVVGELDQESFLPEQIDLRFTVRPGLTGWAQVHGRDSLTWLEKASMDIYFVKLKGYKKFLAILYILFYTPIYLFKFSATYEKRKP